MRLKLSLLLPKSSGGIDEPRPTSRTRPTARTRWSARAQYSATDYTSYDHAAAETDDQDPRGLRHEQVAREQRPLIAEQQAVGGDAGPLVDLNQLDFEQLSLRFAEAPPLGPGRPLR